MRAHNNKNQDRKKMLLWHKSCPMASSETLPFLIQIFGTIQKKIEIVHAVMRFDCTVAIQFQIHDFRVQLEGNVCCFT